MQVFNMDSTSLDWKDFDWSKFQTLCISIAENIVPDCKFDEYLKKGQPQDGIDLISSFRSDGTTFTIQCKRENKLGVSDIPKIVSEFLAGKFRQNCSHFVLATSADLQKKEIQDEIIRLKEELFNNFRISFECWDRQAIETRLKDMWRIVAYYFSLEIADRFCYPQLKYDAVAELSPVEDYIPRKIVAFANNDPTENPTWFFARQNLYDLKEILFEESVLAKYICLIGDAYQGKSSYLKQTAFDLAQASRGICPLLVEIKKYNVQSLETILNSLFGAWRSTPLKDLVLIIDGLDEVPTDRFIEMVNYINEFHEAYRPVNIILSCRKLFFNLYDIGSRLKSFLVYELYTLTSDDIDYYLKKKIGLSFSDFKDEVYKKGLWSMLYHPFYLVNVVDEYLQPPNRIPENKIKVLQGFIERTLKSSLQRQAKGNEILKHESVKFQDVVERLAFALQLAGVNSFTDVQMQQLFTANERVLLQHNSLISVSSDTWSFTNALFQEHLAAALLAKLSFEQITQYCSVGVTARKIKTKWIQTISSLFSLLEFENPLFEQMLTFVEQDNIELLFQTESSKYPDEFKLLLLKRLAERCIKLNIRPVVIYEETISVFIDTCSQCKDFLLDCLTEQSATEGVKIVFCRILKDTLLSSDQQSRFCAIVEKQITGEESAAYASHLVKVLASHKLGDKDSVQRLISFAKLNDQHEFRDSVYELIVSLRLVDEFYDYGLLGVAPLVRYNQDVMHSGSDRSLQDFFLATESTRKFSELLDQSKSESWFAYLEHRSYQKKEFLQKLFERLVEIFQKRPSIIFPVARFIKNLGKRYLRDEYKELDVFLEKTNTHWLVVRILIQDIFIDNDWELGSLITHDSYDYILFEYEEGNYDVQQLRTCLSGLRFKHKTELADTFYNLCMDATEGTIENKYDSEQHLLYLEGEKQKRRNDLQYIQSLENFKAGIKQYFDAYGKATIPKDDLFIELSNQPIRKNADSHFIFEYLLRWVNNKQTITLGECLKPLDNVDLFENFRAEEICDYPYLDEEAKRVLLPILEGYYLSTLVDADFRNSFWIENDRFSWRRKENLLGQIFEKFQFETPQDKLIDLIWLDRSGSRGMETAQINKTTTIGTLILQKLSQAGLVKFKMKLVSNIKDGIKLDSVLGTHIALCKKLGIIEARDAIFDCINRIAKNNTERIDAVTAYLDLGGNLNKIVAIYQSSDDFNEYFFYHLTAILYKTRPDVVREVGLRALESAATSAEGKIRIAQILAEVGSIDGFTYLVEQVRLFKKAPHHIQGGHRISRINTKAALKILIDVISLVVDKKYDTPRSFHDSAKSIIMEWLNTLANKSETDLNMVVSFLERAKEELAGQYSEEEVSGFNWYINRMLEDFRGSDKTNKPISEIKSIISNLAL